MKGGGHEEDIALIRKFLLPIPANLIATNEAQVNKKYQFSLLSDFLDNIVPRDPDMLEFLRLLKEYPIPVELGERLKATLVEIKKAKIRRQGTTIGQPFLLSLAQKFQSELDGILRIIIATPPARKANIDWFPSLQKLHRVAKDYAIFKEPTQGARINADFDRVDTASKKDAKENRKDGAERKLLESTKKFSKGILDTWFDRVRKLVDVPSPFREQEISKIWALLVPLDMSKELVDELHSIFDRHTAFLSAKELDVPLAPPLVAPEAKPSRPGRKVLPKPDEAPAAVLAPPLPPSAPESPVLTGELQAPPKELEEVSPPGPAPGLGIPESVAVSAPVARRGDKGSKSLAASAPLAATPAAPFGVLSAAPPQVQLSRPNPLPVPQYTSAALPGPTDVERGALVAASDRAPLQARTEGEVPVHEPLPELPEGAAPPERVPVKEPGLFDGLASLLPSFLSTPAPASQLGATPALSNVNKPETSVVPEYVAQPAPSTASQLALPPQTRFNPLDRTFTPPAPKAYNPFKSYPIASVTSDPFPSPGKQGQTPFELLQLPPPSVGLSTQATPAVPGLKSEEQKAFEKGAYQSIDTSKSLCERLHPRLYEILKTGQFNGKSIFSMINQQDPELTDFFTEIGFDIADKTLMGHPISEIYKACHPDRTISDPNLTTIFQVLQALYNYTGAVQPVLNLPSSLRIESESVKPVQAPGLKPERPGKKQSAVEPPAGDLTQFFKRGDTLVPKKNIVHRETGQRVILTVIGDYDASTGTIKVGDGKNVFNPPVDALVKDFRVIPRKVEKRLFKQGDRVLIKNPSNIERFPLAIRAEVQKSTCNDPFYATVERDQEVNLRYVKIVCDKGGRYNAEDEELIYIPPGPARLTRTPGEAPPQPTPVAALADSGAPILRKGDRATGAPSALGAPATTTDCDRKLIGMTDRAKRCEENLAQVKAQLEAALAAHAAETAKLQGDLGTSQKDLRRLNGVKTGVDFELAGTNRALYTIREMLGEQTRKLGTLNTRYETLDKQKVKLEGQLAGEQGKSAGLEGELAAVTSERDDLTQKRVLLSAEIVRQRGELEVLERKAADLEAQFASTKALIVQKGDEIRQDLSESVRHIDSGLTIIQEGVQDVTELVVEAKEDIATSRETFGRQIAALQRELEQKNLQGRHQVLAQIGALRYENQQALRALNTGLAAAMTETARLNELLRVETDAKAQAQGALAAAQAAAAAAAAAQAQELASAREASDRAFTEFREASERGSAEERQRLMAEARLAMEELARGLNAQQAIAVARADEAARRDLGAQLAALQAQIAALPPPYVPPPPLPPQPFPIITGRTPAGEVAVGSNINIQWEPCGTARPWILKIFYDGANPDFKDIQAEGDIVYTVKQPGALTGQIFSIV